MKLLIGIPAHNEGKIIGNILGSLPRKIKGIRQIKILVVDDGSNDNTRQIAKKKKVIVLTHLINRGLGGALKTIFAYASKHSFDILVTFDADGQHKAEDIRRLIEPILKNKSDVVVGSRWKKGSRKPTSRYLINIIANIFTFILYGLWTTDSQSGLRAFSKTAIKKIRISTDGMEVSSEIINKIKRNNLRLSEIEIKAIYTDYSKKKGQKLANAPNIFFQLLLRLLR